MKSPRAKLNEGDGTDFEARVDDSACALAGGDGGVSADPHCAGRPDRADAWRWRDVGGYRSASAQLWAGCAAGDAVLHDSVLHLILQRYPYTLALTVAATLLGALMAIPAGVASARRQNRWPDRTIGVVSLFGLSFPNFALGPILIVVFSIGLGLLPVSGAGVGTADFLRHLILPAITLGLGMAAILTRMVRTSMLEELGQDYIRTARAKGLSENAVVYRHALRNALNPVLTVLGLQFGSLLSGAIVTETIFGWPGLGRLTLSAISNRDYALVQGCILAIGLTYVAVNLITDSVYSLADPRMRR